MRDTLRDLLIGIAALAALFAAYQSWTNGRDLAAARTDLTEKINAVRTDLTEKINAVDKNLTAQVGELRGALETTSDLVNRHVNSGLHLGEPR